MLLGMLTLSVALGGGLTWLITSAARRWDRRAEATRGASHRVCGRCGYRTEGWATWSCPECGTDRREVRPREVLATSWRGEALLLLPGAAATGAVIAVLAALIWWLL